MALASDLKLPLLTVVAPLIAAAQGVEVASLHRIGLVDRILDERPDDAEERRPLCERMGKAIEDESAIAAASDVNVVGRSSVPSRPDHHNPRPRGDRQKTCFGSHWPTPRLHGAPPSGRASPPVPANDPHILLIRQEQ
jgi:hypothetical protein